MSYAFGAVAFIAALLITVVLHEAGHFLTAKRFGMKASQFFVGFGPTLWSWHKGETEYGVKAILLGGFVKITGYTPLEELSPADESRAFYRQPAGRRAVVIAGGVVTNFLLAFVLLMVLAMAVGLPDRSNGTTEVDRVSACAPGTRQAADQGVCREGDPPSPARTAGLRRGDVVVEFDRRPVRDWDQLTQAIRDNRPGDQVTIVVNRDGTRHTLRATLAPAMNRPGAFLGMNAVFEPTLMGPVEASGFAVQTMGRTFVAIGEVVIGIPSAIPKLFTPERAETPGGQAGSIVGGAQVSGQVFAADAAWRSKIALFLSIVISLNLFVGAINVLPLLPLDGGHLAVLCYERIKARIFRARGRPDPGPVDMAKLIPVTYVAFVLLVGLGVLLILADVFNPLRLPQ